MAHCNIKQEVYGLSKGNCCFDADSASGSKNCKRENTNV